MSEATRRQVDERTVLLDDPFWGTGDSLEFFEKHSGTALPAEAQRVPTPDSKGRHERGVLLRAGPIRLQNGPDLFNHDAYTVLIDFSKEQERDAGYLVSFDGSFSLFVGRNSLQASLSTDLGDKRLSSGEINLETGRWYGLALVFSGATGRADLYLDARRLCAAADLKGARQAANFFADLFIGNPKGESFSGRIDNFEFFGQALSPGQIVGI